MACGSIIAGNTRWSSFQVSERRPEPEDLDGSGIRRRGGSSRVGDVVAGTTSEKSQLY